MRVLSTRAHGAIDYTTGLLPVLMPCLFGFAAVVRLPNRLTRPESLAVTIGRTA